MFRFDFLSHVRVDSVTGLYHDLGPCSGFRQLLTLDQSRMRFSLQEILHFELKRAPSQAEGKVFLPVNRIVSFETLN